MSEEVKRPRFAAKIVRATIIGMMLGAISYIGTYMLCRAVNTIADANILDQVGFPLMMFAFVLLAALGIELSEHIE